MFVFWPNPRYKFKTLLFDMLNMFWGVFGKCVFGCVFGMRSFPALVMAIDVRALIINDGKWQISHIRDWT